MPAHEKTFPFTDTTIETAAVICTFLDFLHTRPLAEPTGANLLLLYRAMIFADKWECSIILDTMKYRLSSYLPLEDGVCPLFVFIAAAAFDVRLVCYRAITLGGEQRLNSDEPMEWDDTTRVMGHPRYAVHIYGIYGDGVWRTFAEPLLHMPYL
jgi:hypothetical protein